MNNYIEYKNINLLNVKYGFCWIRRDENNVISKSTHPINNLLEEIDKEAFEKTKLIEKLEARLKEAKEMLKEFLTTECKQTWVAEMYATIDDFLNKTGEKNE